MIDSDDVDADKRKEFMGELEKKKNENYGMVCRNFAEIKKCNRSDDRYQSGSISQDCIRSRSDCGGKSAEGLYFPCTKILRNLLVIH